jgi:hypothetical protein
MMDVGHLFSEAVRVLRKYPIIVAPSVVAVLAVFLLTLALPPDPEQAVHMLGVAFVSMLLSLYAYGVTLAMAREVLETGSTSLRTAGFIAARLAGSFLAAGTLMTLLVGAGFMIFILPGVVIYCLLMFTFPAMVVDTVGVLEAMRLSVATVRANVKDAVLLFGVVVAVGLVFGMVNLLLDAAGSLGQAIGTVLSGIFVGGVSVAMIIAYRTLRSAGKPAT